MHENLYGRTGFFLTCTNVQESRFSPFIGRKSAELQRKILPFPDATTHARRQGFDREHKTHPESANSERLTRF
jgi:hypothetical protein